MSVRDNDDRIRILKEGNASIQEEIIRLRRRPTGIVALILLIIGIISLVLSIIHSNQILTMIGIALTFWGGLLIYIRPSKFLRKSILDSIVVSDTDILGVLRELNYLGRPRYLSSSTLERAWNVMLFVPTTEEPISAFPDEFWVEGMRSEEPMGIKLRPKGLGLAKLIERGLGRNVLLIDLEFLKLNLESLLVDRLEIAGNFEMDITDEKINVTISRTGFNAFYESDDNSTENGRVYDVLISALACLFVVVRGGPIYVEGVKWETDAKAVTAVFSSS